MIEESIFQNLIYNEDYFRTVIPHLKKEYFSDFADQRMFSYIRGFGDKYNKRPDPTVLKLLLEKDTSLNEGIYETLSAQIDNLKGAGPDLSLTDFMVEETENFCKQQALYNALKDALEIKANAEMSPDKRNKKLADIGCIPDMLRDALGVCFDTSVGHNYMEDWETRYESYHNKEAKIPFDIEILNKVTKGGAEYKTLNLILAGSNAGKSLGLCHLAAGYLNQGLNVLYISMEMSEESIGKRIDANLLNVSMDDLDAIPKEYFGQRIAKLKEKTLGKLFFKQFPTGAAHVGHFRTLLQELKTKKNFVPQVIIIDYLGICASSRVGYGGENSYGYVKAIAEELRGMAIETNTCIWSAAQTTRGSWEKSDIDMGDTAESAGLVHTADFILGIVETDELAQQGQQMFKQVKSRYGDKSKWSRFFIAVDKGLQRWSELPNNGFAEVAEQPNKPQAQHQSASIANDSKVPGRRKKPGENPDATKVVW